MSNGKIVILTGLLLGASFQPAAAQTPAEILQITEIHPDLQNHDLIQLKIKNLGQKPISAIVLGWDHPIAQAPWWAKYGAVDLRANYLMPGQERELGGPSDKPEVGDAHGMVAALAFSDGTVLGTAVSEGGGGRIDYVQSFFDQRAAEAKEWAKFREQLGSSFTLDDFIRIARSMPASTNKLGNAHDTIRIQVQPKAEELAIRVAQGTLTPEEARAHLLAWLDLRTTEIQQLAMRRTE